MASSLLNPCTLCIEFDKSIVSKRAIQHFLKEIGKIGKTVPVACLTLIGIVANHSPNCATRYLQVQLSYLTSHRQLRSLRFGTCSTCCRRSISSPLPLIFLSSLYNACCLFRSSPSLALSSRVDSRSF